MALEFGFLVFPRIQQLDLTAAYEVFASLPGANVHLIWKNLQPVLSATGLQLTPTCRFAECPRLDVLCVPGGAGVNLLLRDAEVLQFVRAQAATARYVTSVCTGALLLGAAGLLKGRRATTHWMSMDFLAAFGAEPVRERVVQDGNLITSNGVTSGLDLGLTVVAELAGRFQAEAIQLAFEYAPVPPFAAGSPETAPPEVLEAVRKRLGASRREREGMLLGGGFRP